MATERVILNDGTAVLIDDVDAEWARQWSWSHSAARPGRPGYAARGGQTDGRKWLRYMHREIAVRAGVFESYDDPRQVDHRNRDHFDNRRQNLRPATQSEQNANVAPRTPSGMLGVYEYRPGKWGIEYQREGRRVRKYGFATAEAAAAWRAEQLEATAA